MITLKKMQKKAMIQSSVCVCVCVCVHVCVCMHVCVALGKSLEEMTLNCDPNNQKEASGEI